MDSIRIRCYSEDFGNRIAVGIWSDDGKGFAKQIVFKEVQEGAYLEPVAWMSNTNAQSLMDLLWQCGFRPTEGSGSAGAMKAVERHLEDMRAITAQKLGVRLK